MSELTESEKKSKDAVELILLVTEIYIAECKSQDIILNKENKLVNRELKMYLSNLFSCARKISTILQSKFNFDNIDVQNEIANDIEDINKLFIISTKEQRKETIEHLLNILENQNGRPK